MTWVCDTNWGLWGRWRAPVICRDRRPLSVLPAGVPPSGREGDRVAVEGARVNLAYLKMGVYALSLSLAFARQLPPGGSLCLPICKLPYKSKSVFCLATTTYSLNFPLLTETKPQIRTP